MAVDITRQAKIIFEADTSRAQAQVQALAQSLQGAINYGFESSGMKMFDQQLQAATKDAIQLQVQLQNAMNVNTGKLDLTKFNQSLKTSHTTLQQYQQSLAKLGSSGQAAFASLAQSIVSAEIPMQRVSATLDKLLISLKNTITWNISSSLMNGFISSIQTAFNYSEKLNESLNRIQIVTGESTAQMAKFAQQANQSAQALSTTTRKYTDAALIFYQQGLSDRDVKARTDAVIKMANVTGDASKEVSNYMTAIWNNFDDGTSSLESFEDKIVALGATTASSSAEIAAGLEKFAAIGNTIGLSFDYAAAALATVVAETRQSADTVGTAFRTLFSRLQGLKLGDTLEDGTTLNKYSEALASVGVQIKDATGQLKDMDTILEELAAQWDNLDRAQQTALAQTVGGARQYTTLISLMENWGQFQKNLTTEATSEGELQKQADIYASSWQAAKDRVTAAMESIYKSLIDDQFFIKMNTTFAELLKGVNNFITGMGGVKGVLTTIGALTTSIFEKQMVGALRNLGTNLKLLTKTGQQEMLALQTQAVELSTKMAESASNGSGVNLIKDAYAAQAQTQLELINNNSKLTDQERQMAQFAQQRVQENAQIAIQLGEQINQLEQQAALKAKGVDAAHDNLSAQFGSMNVDGFNVDAKLTAVDMLRDKIQELMSYREQLNGLLDGLIDVDKTQANLDALKAEIDKLPSDADGPLDQLKTSVADIFDDKTLNVGEKFGRMREEIQTSMAGINTDVSTYGTQIKTMLTELGDKAAAEGKADLAASVRTLISELEKEEDILGRLNAAKESARQATANLKNSEGVFADIMQKAGASTLSATEQIVKFGQVLMSLGTIINQVKGLINVFNDDTKTMGEKFTTLLTTAGMLIPIVMMMTKNLAALGASAIASGTGLAGTALGMKLAGASAGAATPAVVGFGAAMRVAFLEVTLIVGAITALIGLIVLLNKDWGTHTETLVEKNKSLKNSVNEVTSELDDLKSSADSVRESFEAYDSVVKQIDSCREGTEEWRDKLLEVNQAYEDVLSKNPELVSFIANASKYGYDTSQYRDTSGRYDLSRITQDYLDYTSRGEILLAAYNSQQQATVAEQNFQIDTNAIVEGIDTYVTNHTGHDDYWDEYRSTLGMFSHTPDAGVFGLGTRGWQLEPENEEKYEQLINGVDSVLTDLRALTGNQTLDWGSVRRDLGIALLSGSTIYGSQNNITDPEEAFNAWLNNTYGEDIAAAVKYVLGGRTWNDDTQSWGNGELKEFADEDMLAQARGIIAQQTPVYADTVAVQRELANTTFFNLIPSSELASMPKDIVEGLTGELGTIFQERILGQIDLNKINTDDAIKDYIAEHNDESITKIEDLKNGYYSVRTGTGKDETELRQISREQLILSSSAVRSQIPQGNELYGLNEADLLGSIVSAIPTELRSAMLSKASGLSVYGNYTASSLDAAKTALSNIEVGSATDSLMQEWYNTENYMAQLQAEMQQVQQAFSDYGIGADSDISYQQLVDFGIYAGNNQASGAIIQSGLSELDSKGLERLMTIDLSQGRASVDEFKAACESLGIEINETSAEWQAFTSEVLKGSPALSSSARAWGSMTDDARSAASALASGNAITAKQYSALLEQGLDVSGLISDNGKYRAQQGTDLLGIGASLSEIGTLQSYIDTNGEGGYRIKSSIIDDNRDLAIQLASELGYNSPEEMLTAQKTAGIAASSGTGDGLVHTNAAGVDIQAILGNYANYNLTDIYSVAAQWGTMYAETMSQLDHDLANEYISSMVNRQAEIEGITLSEFEKAQFTDVDQLYGENSEWQSFVSGKKQQRGYSGFISAMSSNDARTEMIRLAGKQGQGLTTEQQNTLDSFKMRMSDITGLEVGSEKGQINDQWLLDNQQNIADMMSGDLEKTLAAIKAINPKLPEEQAQAWADTLVNQYTDKATTTISAALKSALTNASNGKFDNRSIKDLSSDAEQIHSMTAAQATKGFTDLGYLDDKGNLTEAGTAYLEGLKEQGLNGGNANAYINGEAAYDLGADAATQLWQVTESAYAKGISDTKNGSVIKKLREGKVQDIAENLWATYAQVMGDSLNSADQSKIITLARNMAKANMSSADIIPFLEQMPAEYADELLTVFSNVDWTSLNANNILQSLEDQGVDMSQVPEALQQWLVDKMKSTLTDASSNAVKSILNGENLAKNLNSDQLNDIQTNLSDQNNRLLAYVAAGYVEATDDPDNPYGYIITDAGKKAGYASIEALDKAIQDGLEDASSSLTPEGLAKRLPREYTDIGTEIFQVIVNKGKPLSDSLRTSISSALDKAFTSGGTVGLNTMAEILKKSVNPEELANTLAGLDWSKGFDSVQDQLENAGVDTSGWENDLKLLCEALQDAKKYTDSLTQAMNDYAKNSSIMSKVRQGQDLNEEDYQQLVKELGPVLAEQITTAYADGTYKIADGYSEWLVAKLQTLSVEGFDNTLQGLQSAIQLIQEGVQGTEEARQQFAESYANSMAEGGGGYELYGVIADMIKTAQADQNSEYYDTVTQNAEALEQNLEILRNPNVTPDAVQQAMDAIAEILLGQGKRLEDLLGQQDSSRSGINLSRDVEVKTSTTQERRSSVDTIEAKKTFDEKLDDWGQTASEVDKLADKLQKTADSSAELSKELKTNRQEAREIAKDVKRFEDAMESVSKNYESWEEAAKSGKITTAIAEDIDTAMSNLLDIDTGTLSDGFLRSTENLQLLKEAAEGSEEAYERLQEAARQDIIARCDLDRSEFDAKSAELQSELDAMNFQTLQIGADLDTGNALQAMTDLVNAANMTAEQATSYLSTMGIDAEVKTVETPAEDTHQDVEYNEHMSIQPNTSTASVAETDENGNIRQTTFEQNVPSYVKSVDLNPVETTTESTNTAFALEVTSAHKSSGGQFKFNNSKQPTTRSSRGGRRGGGGTRRREETPRTYTGDQKKASKRYTTNTNQLEDIQDKLNKINNAENRAYGRDRLKQMKTKAETLKELAKKQKDLYNEAVAYQKADKWDLEHNALAGRMGLKFEFDESGTLLNREALEKQMVEFYNSYTSGKDANGNWILKDNSEAGKSAFTAMQEAYADLEELIDKYEESQDKVKQYWQSYIDSINQAYDLVVEMATYKVEVQVDVSDNALKIIDLMLQSIEDNAYKAGEAIAHMSEQAYEYMAQNNINDRGLYDLLMHHNESFEYFTDEDAQTPGQSHMSTIIEQGTIVDALYGDADKMSAAWQEIMQHEGEFTQDELDSMQEMINARLEAAQKMLELQKSVYAEISKVFDQGTQDMKRLVSDIEHAQKISDSYNNIIDLVGAKRLGFTSDMLNDMDQKAINMSLNKLRANRTMLETQQSMLTSLQTKFANGENHLNDEQRKFFKDQAEAVKSQMTAEQQKLATQREQTRELVDQGYLMEDAVDISRNLEFGDERVTSDLDKSAKLSLEKYELYMKLAREDAVELTERDKELLQDQFDHIEDEIQTQTETFYSSWEEAIQKIGELYTKMIERATSDASEQFAGNMRNLETLQDQFNKTRTLSGMYLDDYERIYELSKLNRDINNSIDEYQNVKAKQELRDLQIEINKMDEENGKLSSYQVENARRRYELTLARLQLEEAQNTKSRVQMSRSETGNWSYVYTADENDVANAEQNYEDKLFAMQQANGNYINELQQNMIQLQSDMINEIQSLRVEDFASYEDYKKEVQRITSYYNELMNINAEQLKIVLGENQRLYTEDWTAYSEATGYKISLDEEYKDRWEELELAELTGFSTLEEYHENFNDVSQFLLDKSEEAYRTWEDNIETAMVEAGTSIDDFSTDAQQKLDELEDKTREAAESMKELSKTVEEAFDDMVAALSNWQAEYSKALEDMLEKNTLLAKSFNELLKQWSGYQETVGQSPTTFETPTDTGEDPEGFLGLDPLPEPVSEPVVTPPQEETQEDKTAKYGKMVALAVWEMPGGADWGHGSERRRNMQAKGLDYDIVQGHINRMSGKSFARKAEYAGVPNPNSYGGSDWRDKRRQLLKPYTRSGFSFDTGGYTGEWFDGDGRLAILHSKEIVLNKDDTANFLSGINILRDISRAIDLNALANVGYLSSPSVATTTSSSMVEQTVHIQAEFPNATDKNAIEEAFADLINRASQYANRKL